MAHNDGSVHTRYHKDFTDGTLKNGSGRSSCPGLDINALAVGLHVFEFLKFLLAKVHDDGSRFVQGEGEFAFVVAKVVGQYFFVYGHGIAAFAFGPAAFFFEAGSAGFFSNDFLNLFIEPGGQFAVFFELGVQCRFLFFEGIQQVALFFSFLAQAVALGLLFIEQLFLLLISHLQIDAFFFELYLFLTYFFGLLTLKLGVFIQVANTAIALAEVFGRKNKHQLIVYFEPGMKLFY